MEACSKLKKLLELYDTAFQHPDGCGICGESTDAELRDCGHRYCLGCAPSSDKCGVQAELTAQSGRTTLTLKGTADWIARWCEGRGAQTESADPGSIALELRLLGKPVVRRELCALCADVLSALPDALKEQEVEEPYLVISCAFAMALRKKHQESIAQAVVLQAVAPDEESVMFVRNVAAQTVDLVLAANDDNIELAPLQEMVLALAIELCEEQSAKRPFIVALRGYQADILKALKKMGVPQHHGDCLVKCCDALIPPRVTLGECVKVLESVKKAAKLAYQAKVLMYHRVEDAKNRLKILKGLLKELVGRVLPSEERTEPELLRRRSSMCSESEMSTLSPHSQMSASSQSTFSADEIRNAEKNIATYFSRFDYEGEGVLRDSEDVEMLVTSLCVKLQLEMGVAEMAGLMPTQADMPAQGWTLELFKEWFINTFFMNAADQSPCSTPASSPAHTPRQGEAAEGEQCDL